MTDSYHLHRFVTAQEPLYHQVLSELRAGRKQTHWMWFIFPQIQGLGHSEMARRFAISSIEEAACYLQHAVLGPRLLECCSLVAAVQNRSVDEIFGYPDNLKFHSSLTLFAEMSTAKPVFTTCLEKYFDGQKDGSTLRLLGH